MTAVPAINPILLKATKLRVTFDGTTLNHVQQVHVHTDPGLPIEMAHQVILRIAWLSAALPSGWAEVEALKQGYLRILNRATEAVIVEWWVRLAQVVDVVAANESPHRRYEFRVIR